MLRTFIKKNKNTIPVFTMRSTAQNLQEKRGDNRDQLNLHSLYSERAFCSCIALMGGHVLWLKTRATYVCPVYCDNNMGPFQCFYAAFDSVQAKMTMDAHATLGFQLLERCYWGSSRVSVYFSLLNDELVKLVKGLHPTTMNWSN